MLVFKILLIIVEAICSLLLIGVILLQKTKGEGLGMAFGAEMGESLFGARASNALVKITIWLGAIFVVNTIVLAMVYSNASRRSVLSDRPRPAAEQPVMPDAGMPNPIQNLPAPPAAMPEAPATAPALPGDALPPAQPGT